MRISVVVPVWNSERTIGRTIESLLGQSLPPAEIIAVDDGSTDGSRDVLRRFGNRIRLLSRANGGPAAARNSGLREAKSELIAFTDSDCYPERDWLAALAGGFADPRVGGVGGVVRGAHPGLCGEYLDLIRLLDPAIDATGEIVYLITANACFRREALFAAGLFDEGFRLPGGEEADLGHRVRQLGYHFRLIPEALVRHEHRRGPIALMRTLANYGEGAARMSMTGSGQQITDPRRRLLRRSIAIRSLALRTWQRRELGLKRAVCFALLDHCREPAFLFGYIRGESQRHYPLP